MDEMPEPAQFLMGMTLVVGSTGGLYGVSRKKWGQ